MDQNGMYIRMSWVMGLFCCAHQSYSITRTYGCHEQISSPSPGARRHLDNVFSLEAAELAGQNVRRMRYRTAGNGLAPSISNRWVWVFN